MREFGFLEKLAFFQVLPKLLGHLTAVYLVKEAIRESADDRQDFEFLKKKSFANFSLS